MKEDIRRLKYIAFDVIEEEHLPKPKDIKFRYALSGVKARQGCCIRNKLNNNFRIIVNLVIAKFFEDNNGKFTNKEGKHFRRAEIGQELNFDEIKENTAHEIAHLKFWEHSAQHKVYTSHILLKLNERLGAK